MIGEAAKAAVAADSTIESEFPGIEWSPWAKMRDVVTHQYWRTNHAIGWSTAGEDVPRLAEELRRVK